MHHTLTVQFLNANDTKRSHKSQILNKNEQVNFKPENHLNGWFQETGLLRTIECSKLSETKTSFR